MQRLVIRGRRRDLGLGAYPLVSLAEARQKALQNRRVARVGGDPSERKEEPPTFREMYEQEVERRARHWRSPQTERKWRRLYRDLIEPVIRDKRVDHVNMDDVERIVVPHWRGRGSPGYIVRQHLDIVLELAKARGHRSDNPARLVKTMVPKVKAVVEHQPMLPHDQVREAMAAILASRNDPVVKDALLFTVLCAARIGEVAGARWQEINEGTRVWRRPAERMKGGVAHRVPLAEQAMGVLERMRALGRSDSLVFVLPDGRQVASHDFKRVLDPLGFVDPDLNRPIVMHGFRATFGVWAMEVAVASREAREIALAHSDTETAGAYGSHRTDMIEYRRELMQKWADYVVPRP